MGTLVRSQRGVLIASLVTLVLAAACEVAVPHYSSRALNAAAFAKDRVVSGIYPESKMRPRTRSQSVRVAPLEYVFDRLMVFS